MRHSNKIIVASVILLSVGCWKLTNEARKRENRASSAPKEAPALPPLPKGEALVDQPKGHQGIASDKVAASLKSMTAVLAEFARPNQTHLQLEKHLLATGQGPYEVDSGKEGAIKRVFTSRPPIGTQNFTAQYWPDEKGVHAIQHMSFELRPSPTALADARAEVERTFNVGSPVEESENFVRWELPDGYMVWVKRQLREDLEGDAKYAYDLSTDIGLIMIAVQEDPHAGDEH